jgi:lipopolysaccharide biosynthesis protein
LLKTKGQKIKMPNKTRTAIFAHYDKDNVIDDYVIYYLNALKKVAQKIIFVSDCDLNSTETDKLQGIADSIIAQPHGEYDFGSYKRGFLFAQKSNWLIGTDILIFANDSCFGPFFPLENIFEKMASETCDFWGITQNNKFKIFKKLFWEPCEKSHIQSYFFVLKKEVFTSDVFLNFIKSIKKEKSRNEVILKYEIGLSEVLLENNFVMKSFINAHLDEFSPFLHKAQELILNHGMPLLKCSIPRGRYVGIQADLAAIAKVSDYPIEMIEKHASRTRISHFFLLSWLKKLKNILRK